ncbi:Uncharacterised protein [Streptococcus criceti]|uniref:Uncharacterized protein n=1 Tax=Streptococcus criceti HS-6 TaxID=873449 RepID=G5JR51_STRCG|nr:hypothetical protein [Streptococcus criceti]EHI74112.1 hypothetical protein STRCR_1936 [Streptococcus criceti HS-6]SUN42975.1 Uncharacterised protein [Streptococcus criceti]
MLQFFRKLLRCSSPSVNGTYRTFKNAPLSPNTPYVSPNQFSATGAQITGFVQQSVHPANPAGFHPMPPTCSTATSAQPAPAPVGSQPVQPVTPAGFSTASEAPTVPFPSVPVPAQTPQPVSLDQSSVPKQKPKLSRSEQVVSQSSPSKKKAPSDQAAKKYQLEDASEWRKNLNRTLERERQNLGLNTWPTPPSKEDLEELERRRAKIKKEAEAESKRWEKRKEIAAKEAEQDKLWQKELGLYDEEADLIAQSRRLDEQEQIAGDVLAKLGGVLEGLVYAYRFSGEIERSYHLVFQERGRADDLLETAKEKVQARKRQVIEEQGVVYTQRQKLTAEIEDLEEEIRKIP